MRRSNCILFALALYRRRKLKGACAYLMLRASHYGFWWHVLYAEKRNEKVRVIQFVPLHGKRKLLPPPFFKGHTRWGD